MRTVIRPALSELRGSPAEILHRLGVPDARAARHFADLIGQADSLFTRIAAPVALFESISPREFEILYERSGGNAPAFPLQEIYPRAESMALFAGTLGAGVGEAIQARFQDGDPALGYVLDVVASAAADRLGELVAARYLGRLVRKGLASRDTRVLPYSPGYCGWHVSGQRALFDHLRPEQIQITLTPRCMMRPTKSVSGALVAGAAEVHRFSPTYPFCEVCRTHECRVRIASMREGRS